MTKKLPAFQFYPGDWLKDPNLRRCTHAAKGVWIDLLCLMFESEERGVLVSSQRAWSDDEIVLAVGGDSAVVRACVQELTLKGVCNRRQDGALYSKRLVRDEHKRLLCIEAGKRGGNPNLTQTLKGHSKGGLKGDAKGGPKRNPTPSSSSSSSDIIPPIVPQGGDKEAGAEVPLQAKPEKPKSETQLRAEKLMRRREATPWTANELRAWQKNRACIEATTPDQWQALEVFYAAPQHETFARKDLATLLNNWNGEIDRSIAWKSSAKSSLQNPAKDWSKVAI